MLEGPLRHLSTLLPCCCVRASGVNALVDTDVFHILGQIRESGVGARRLDG